MDKDNHAPDAGATPKTREIRYRTSKLVGQRFGRWVVIDIGTARWGKKPVVRCDCGTERAISRVALTHKGSESCGCLAREQRECAKAARLASATLPNGVDDLTGRRFGLFRVLSFVGCRAKPSGQRLLIWNVICDCGTAKALPGVVLKRAGRAGHTVSCGCYRRAFGVKIGKLALRHGMCGSPEYRSWMSMRTRCYDPKATGYDRYGERGVCVCARWRDDFEAFYADMGPRLARTSINRKNNDGNYSCGKCEECIANGWPANCHWATGKEQMRNTSCNRMVTVFGETLCVSEWAERFGMKPVTLAGRIRRGWRPEIALTTATDRASVSAALAAEGRAR